MATLKSIAEQAWKLVFPNPGDEASITKHQFLATSKLQYAYQYLLLYWKNKREEGETMIPSHLLAQAELEVVDNEVDTSELKVFRAFGMDFWLSNIGGLTCSCKYVKSNVNHTQLLCGDDSLDEDVKTYIPLGKKIIFPRGTHASPLLIIYANMGENVDGDVEVEESIGALIFESLVNIYSKKGVEDVTNNSNSQV